MEKPTSKAELLKGIREERKRLEKALKGFSPRDMAAESAPDDWSVKDNMAHIADWEEQFLKWYETGLRGEKQVMPEWNTPGLIDEINLGIYQRNLNRELKDVKKEFDNSYKRILKTVESIPEEAMFTHGKYDWTGKDTLAIYIYANTIRHYAEHLEMIEAIKKKISK